MELFTDTQARPRSRSPPGRWGTTRGASIARMACDRRMWVREPTWKGRLRVQGLSWLLLVHLHKEIPTPCCLVVVVACEVGFRREGLLREENRFMKRCGRILGTALGQPGCPVLSDQGACEMRLNWSLESPAWVYKLSFSANHWVYQCELSRILVPGKTTISWVMVSICWVPWVPVASQCYLT